MNRRPYIATAVTLSVQVALSGCVTQNTPGDLTLTSIQVVDNAAQNQLPRPNSRAAFTGVLGGQTLAQGSSEDRRHRPLLIVKVTSATDLTRLSYAVTLGLQSRFCRWPDEYVRLDLPYIFSRGRDVRFISTPSPSGNSSNALFTYEIYFPLARHARVSQIPSSQDHSFNLITDPEDICFNIVGGAYRRFGYSSNTVMISKEVVSGAIRKDLGRLFPNQHENFELD